MSLMALLLAAEARGLGATGIGALANYGPQVHTLLDLPEDEMVVTFRQAPRLESSAMRATAAA
ncbi:hypothetical protein [Paracoccus mutanolyticus]|nr:hypothetical protein [Paracoccus mutanolyticus]